MGKKKIMAIIAFLGSILGTMLAFFVRGRLGRSKSRDTDKIGADLRSELDRNRERNTELESLANGERERINRERDILESDGQHLDRASEIISDTRRTVEDIISDAKKEQAP